MDKLKIDIAIFNYLNNNLRFSNDTNDVITKLFLIKTSFTEVYVLKSTFKQWPHFANWKEH